DRALPRVLDRAARRARVVHEEQAQVGEEREQEMKKAANTIKAKAIKAKTPTVTVRRAIEASAEELFDAWLDPEAIAQWMRPNGVDSTTAVVDARVGGSYEITMGLRSGPLLHRGVYQEIDRPRRLVFTWSARGPLEPASLVTVDFQQRGRLTEIVVT